MHEMAQNIIIFLATLSNEAGKDRVRQGKERKREYRPFNPRGFG